MDLKNLSIDELLKLVEDAKEVIKEKKANVNEANKEILLGLNAGKYIKILFKGEPTKVIFVGVTASRFTVDINGTKKSILFDKLISVDLE